jgi:glycosyltransferase involved in cell wall biosynthesis
MRYVAWISAQASRLGYEVRLATSDAFFDHPFYRKMQAASEGGIEGVPLAGQGGKPFRGVLGYRFHYHRMFSGLYRRLKKQGVAPDYIMVPYLDYVAHAAGVAGSPFGDTPWGGIFINPHFHMREMGVEAPRDLQSRLKEKLFFRLLTVETLKAVFTFDDLLLRYARAKSPARSGKVRLLPEPAELAGGSSREEARGRLSISPSETVILVYGVLDGSKGLDRLLESARLSGFPEDATLLIAGPQDGATKELLASPLARRLREAGRLRERDEFFHGPEEHSLFLASDIVWVGYRGQYISSGVLLQAGMASLPVIACDEGLIGWLTRNHHLGLSVNPENPKEVAAAVSKLVRNRSLAAKLGANGKEHSKNHTTERFARALEEELQRSFPL